MPAHQWWYYLTSRRMQICCTLNNQFSLGQVGYIESKSSISFEQPSFNTYRMSPDAISRKRESYNTWAYYRFTCLVSAVRLRMDSSFDAVTLPTVSISKSLEQAGQPLLWSGTCLQYTCRVHCLLPYYHSALPNLILTFMH